MNYFQQYTQKYEVDFDNSYNIEDVVKTTDRYYYFKDKVYQRQQNRYLQIYSHWKIGRFCWVSDETIPGKVIGVRRKRWLFNKQILV